MPIVATALKAKMKTRLVNAFKQAFAEDGATNDQASASWEKQAEAISSIAEDICNLLLTEAQVAPGIAVTGAGGGVPGPMSGATTAPGKLI